MKKLLFFIFTLCSLLNLTGSAATISSGDKLTITIKGVPATEQAAINGEYVVSDRGYLFMPMLEGGIASSGVSSSSVARKIEQAYKDAQIYTNPRITIITVRDEKKANQQDQYVTVAGEVKRDGPVQYINGMTIYEAISAAGGKDTFGAMNRVILERNGKERVLNLKNANERTVKVQVGDVITVPQKNALGR